MQEQSQKKAADLERQLAGLQRELGERDAEVAALKRAQQGAVEQQAAMVGAMCVCSEASHSLQVLKCASKSGRLLCLHRHCLA
jgi:hypothetical protein